MQGKLNRLGFVRLIHQLICRCGNRNLIVGVKLGCTEVQGAVQVGVDVVEGDVCCRRNYNRIGGFDAGCNGCFAGGGVRSTGSGVLCEGGNRAGGAKGKKQGQRKQAFSW